jgi:hypothetical protein
MVAEDCVIGASQHFARQCDKIARSARHDRLGPDFGEGEVMPALLGQHLWLGQCLADDFALPSMTALGTSLGI